MTVDHVIPEHLVDKPEQLASVLTEYGLPPEYQVNDFPNWVPAHQSCNRSKGTVVHPGSPAMIRALDRASKRAEVARRKAAQIAREPDQAKAIAMVETWVRADIVQVTDLADVVSRHQGVPVRLVAVEDQLSFEGGGMAAADSTRRADDPFAIEIDAYRRLSDRRLFAEALDGLRDLRRKAETAPGATRSRFRIANNTGVCLLALGQFAEARSEFTRAIELDDTDDLPYVNLAASHLAEGEAQLTLEVLTRPIADTRVRGKACALRIEALARLGRRSEIRDVVDRESWATLDPQVQVALARTSHDAEWYDSRGFTVALDDPSTAVEANLLAGMRVLGLDGAEQGFARIRRDLDPSQLRRASSHFARALESCPADQWEVRADLHAYCGLVHTLLGDSEAALVQYTRAYRVGTKPNINVVANHAGLLMQEGSEAEAARLIADSGLLDEFPQLRLQLGAAHLGAGAHAAAIEALGEFWPLLLTREDQVRGAAVVLDAARRLGRSSLAHELAEQLAESYSDSWEAWFHLGRHFSAADDREQARSAFLRAIALSVGSDEQHAREEFAYRLAGWSDAEGCVAILKPLDPEELDDGAAQALVVSLYNLGDFARAREVSEKLLLRDSVPGPVIEVGAAIASNAGDLDRAILLQRRLLREHPPRLRHINSLGTLLLRRGESSAATEALAIDPLGVEDAATAHDLMVFAHLLGAVGDARALEIGYRAWERGRDQPQVQLGYVGLFLRREQGERDELERDVVEAGTTVKLLHSGNGATRVVSVLRDGDLVPDPSSWVPPTDPLATRLLGKRVGDETPGPSTPLGDTTYRVEQIRANYVRAFQETIAGFNDRFPEADGLWKFEVKNDDPMDITRVLLAALGNASRIREVVDLHCAGRMPVAALAEVLNKPVPVVWSALCHDDKANLRFSDGADREEPTATAVLAGPSPVYFDYTALMTLFALGRDLREKVCALLGEVRVVQAMLDDLGEAAMRAGPYGTGEGLHVGLGDDGRLRVSELGDERGFLLQVEAVVRAVATPCSAYATLDGEPGKRDVIEQVLGSATAAALAEAAAGRFRLVCDDAALAALAQNEWGVGVVSVQGLALAAHRKGLLSLADYSAIVERLAVVRYRFVSLSADVVCAILERHAWQPTSEVEAVFACLQGPGCTMRSAAVVTAHVLKAVVLEPAAALTKNALIDLLLGMLTVGHDVRQLAALVDQLLRRLLQVAPIHLDELQRSLRYWVAART
ncbi:MAG: hypothetical protein L6Q80_12890 [Dehalococcoidia bacterium]|nr:hypothetical protein [Dehalococcoidia bacterium]